MKKHLLVNILASIAFIALDPFLTWCDKWADVHSLGAEMALGMLIPLLLVNFISFAIYSVSISLCKTIVMKDIKQIIPILVIVACITLYITLATQDSMWVRLIEYAKDMILK